jgi:3-oxoacyl-[acyl-carrier-protein] synthase-3
MSRTRQGIPGARGVAVLPSRKEPMQVERLFIAGLGAFLPPPVPVREAVADGRYDAREAQETELESVLVARDESPPDMAIQAARGALARSGIAPEELKLLLHASVFFQGIDLYSTASYIHHAMRGPPSALALEIKGASNGGMASLELAAAHLSAQPEQAAALVTTADRFSPPLIDRWRCDTGMVLADGATAMILSRRKGFARVLSVATVSDPSLEGLHRGHALFEQAPGVVDVHQRKREYLGDVGLQDMLRRFRVGLRGAVQQALRDAGTELRDIARFVVPHVGRILLEREYFAALEIHESATTWPWGRRVGHLGAGDQLAGLGHLVETNALRPGERCLLMGVGAGFTWTCAVIELLEHHSHPTPLFSLDEGENHAH